MKIKTYALEGVTLDFAVAKAKGLEVYLDDGVIFLKGQPFDEYTPYWMPTKNWAQGGPIIERECLELEVEEGVWHSRTSFGFHYYSGKGPTPLVAAMRCYVASKLGDEVDVPDELVEGMTA